MGDAVTTKQRLWRGLCGAIFMAELYILPNAQGWGRLAVVSILALALNELYQPRAPYTSPLDPGRDP